MGDVKLFRINGKATELASNSVKLERELQTLIENNMEEFFGVRFIQSEFKTTHGGRIDSLGLDEDNCPVIFEYKRSSSENVINQGLFYLDWLMDHKASFQLLVETTLGRKASESIDWSIPRLICVANDFSKYDEYAVNQINRNIDLVRYKYFGKELLLFELIHTNTQTKEISLSTDNGATSKSKDKNFEEKLETSSQFVKETYKQINDYINSLGDDIQVKQLKYYVAYKKIKNFACVEVYQNKVVVYLKRDISSQDIINGFTRDVSNIGHFGTGNFEVTINTIEDYENAKRFIEDSYNL